MGTSDLRDTGNPISNDVGQEQSAKWGSPVLTQWKTLALPVAHIAAKTAHNPTGGTLMVAGSKGYAAGVLCTCL